MERARILKWRLEQQAARVQQAEEDARSRTTARLVRPLIEQHLPTFAVALNGSFQTAHEFPTSRIESDRCSIIVFKRIRDHLTTRVFTVSSVNGFFVITIEPAQVELVMIGQFYRRRGSFVDDPDGGHWLPPGDYTEVYPLAQVRWQNDQFAPAAINYFFAQAREQIPQIKAHAELATTHARLRQHVMLRRKLVVWGGIAIYVGIITLVVVWCVMMMYVVVQ